MAKHHLCRRPLSRGALKFQTGAMEPGDLPGQRQAKAHAPGLPGAGFIHHVKGLGDLPKLLLFMPIP